MRGKIFLMAAAAIAALWLIFFYCLHTLPDGRLRVHFLDVGQGDAILMELPDGGRMLIDGGPGEKVMEELNGVLPFYIDAIETIILTHPHPDHLNGLISVLKKYRVEKVILTGVKYSLPAQDEFLALVKKSGAQVLFAGAAKDYRIGNVVLDAVYPPESIQGRAFSNLNNSSLVIRLVYGKNKILLTGDLETEGEEKLEAGGTDLQAELIKIGHHGSRTASGREFIKAVAPSRAVISCGVNNRFKHPHIETMNTLKAPGIKIYRTDLAGRITFMLDGRSMTEG